jgi:hypothetical protein
VIRVLNQMAFPFVSHVYPTYIREISFEMSCVLVWFLPVGLQECLLIPTECSEFVLFLWILGGIEFR